MKLPKYVYRDNITDKVLGFEDEPSNEMLTKIVHEFKSANFSQWKLHTLGKSSWYQLNDRCKSDTEMRDSWNCNCIKCQLKGML